MSQDRDRTKLSPGRRNTPALTTPDYTFDFQRLVDAIPHLIWVGKHDGGTEFCNRPWVEYTGFDLEQMQHWEWLSSVHPDDRQRCISVVQEAMQAGKAIH